MSRARPLHGLSDLGKTEFHIHGDWTPDPVDMKTAPVISTSSLQLLKWESGTVWWADRTSRLRWYTAFWGVGMTIWSRLRSMETSCRQMVRMNDDYHGSVIKVCIFKHSTKRVSPTDAKYANGMENKVLRRSPGVLVRVQLLFVLVDYFNEYEMKSMMNRLLVSCTIASFGRSNMWWKAGAPVQMSTKSNSTALYISLSQNLSKLQTLLIRYCLGGFVIPTSTHGIGIVRSAWTSMCDSNYMFRVHFRRTRH